MEYAGAYYHVMARGNRRKNIFEDDDDRRFFLQVLGEVCGRTGWRVHAWVLMGNHYHLLIETPAANLVEGMKWVQNTYTRRFNVRRRAWGRVFGDRYKAVVVEGDAPDYYRRVVEYIHLNPVRARLVDVHQGGSILDYAWSSVAGGYALAPDRRAHWLAAAEGLRRLDYEDSVAGRRRMVEELDRRAKAERDESGIVPLPENFDARMSHLRRGWYWGSEAFAEKMRGLLKSKTAASRSRAYRGSPERQAHNLQRAEELVTEGLRMANLEEGDLATLPGGDHRRLEIARAVRSHTTVSLGWIAARLKMKSAANVGQQLRTEKLGAAHRRAIVAIAGELNCLDEKSEG